MPSWSLIGLEVTTESAIAAATFANRPAGWLGVVGGRQRHLRRGERLDDFCGLAADPAADHADDQRDDARTASAR